MNMDLGGLKARGGARDVPANRQCAGGLQGDAASPGLRFQPDLPTPRRNLLNAAGNAQKSERQLFVSELEVQTPVLNVDFLETICRSRRELRAIHTRGISGGVSGGGKPAFQVPTALVVAGEDKAGTSKRERAKLEMPAK